MKKKIIFSLTFFLFIFLSNYKIALASPCLVTAECPIPQRNCYATITGFIANATYSLSVDGEVKDRKTSPTDRSASFIITFPNDAPSVGEHNLSVGATSVPSETCGTVFNDNRISSSAPPRSPAPPGGPGVIDFEKLSKAIGLRSDFKTLGNIISELLKYIYVFAGLILFAYLTWGGFSYLTSGGDPKAMEQAKGKVTNAIIGFIIIFIAYWVVQIFEYIFKITVF